MEREAKIFKYERPEFDGVKKSMLMCSSDLMRVHVQVVKSGGENNLHTHTGEDAFWFVLNGAVKFYPPSQKATGVSPWMDGKRVSSVALAEEDMLRTVSPDETRGAGATA